MDETKKRVYGGNQQWRASAGPTAEDHRRRARAAAWDRYVIAGVAAQVALGETKNALPFAVESADVLLAARDERFGKE